MNWTLTLTNIAAPTALLIMTGLLGILRDDERWLWFLLFGGLLIIAINVANKQAIREDDEYRSYYGLPLRK